MSNQVRVEDSEAFALLRVALIKFVQAATMSLSGADSQIARTHSWLENEQTSFWQNQLRKRAEAVAKARDAVRQKKLYKDFTGKTRDAIEEEKFLSQCIAAAEHAQKRLESVRKWLPRLEKASDLYRSGVSRLSRDLDGEIPKAIALLDRLQLSLEHYMQIEAPVGIPDTVAVSTPDDSMSRGNEPQQPSDPATPERPAQITPTVSPDHSASPEAGHVAQ